MLKLTNFNIPKTLIAKKRKKEKKTDINYNLDRY